MIFHPPSLSHLPLESKLHVADLPCPKGEECSLIIPNVSTQGPPTSSAVQVNAGAFSFGSFTENNPANRVRNATASSSVNALSNRIDSASTLMAGNREMAIKV